MPGPRETEDKNVDLDWMTV